MTGVSERGDRCPDLKTKSARVLIGFAGFPDIQKIIDIGSAFKLVVEFVITFIALGNTYSHIGTVIDD